MKLLAAYDGSENSAVALGRAIALAGEADAELTVLHVLNPHTDAIDTDASSASEGLSKVATREQADAEELLKKLGNPPATPRIEAFEHTTRRDRE